MADIIDLIRADHLHITHWAARLGELYRQGADGNSHTTLAAT